MFISGVELWSWRRVSFFPGHLYQPKTTFQCWELGFERYDGKTWMFLLSYYCLLPVRFRFSAFWSMSWLFLAKRLFVCHLCCHGAVAGAPSGSCRWSWGESRDEWVVVAVKLITPTPKLSSSFCTAIFFLSLCWFSISSLDLLIISSSLSALRQIILSLILKWKGDSGPAWTCRLLPGMVVRLIKQLHNKGNSVSFPAALVFPFLSFDHY